MPGERLLVVDDQPDMREAIADCLILYGGYRVIQASSGEEVKKKINEIIGGKVKIGIIDGSLTSIDSGQRTGDGQEVAEYLRGEIEGIKIISFSATRDLKWGDENVLKIADSHETLIDSVKRLLRRT